MDKSLVAPRAVRSARPGCTLDTIREYAAGLLAEAAESAAFGLRLREYSLRTAERTWPSAWPGSRSLAARVDTFRRYDVEPQPRPGAALVPAHGDAETGLRMCTAAAHAGSCGARSPRAGSGWTPLLGPRRRHRCSGPVRARAAWCAPSSPCPAIPPLPSRCASTGPGAVPRGRRGVLDRGRAEPAQRDRAAHRRRKKRRPVNLRRCRPPRRRRVERGLRAGTRAALAALAGELREAKQLASASHVMRRIHHQWGAARALLGLVNLARSAVTLRSAPPVRRGAAHLAGGRARRRSRGAWRPGRWPWTSRTQQARSNWPRACAQPPPAASRRAASVRRAPFTAPPLATADRAASALRENAGCRRCPGPGRTLPGSGAAPGRRRGGPAVGPRARSQQRGRGGAGPGGGTAPG